MTTRLPHAPISVLRTGDLIGCYVDGQLELFLVIDTSLREYWILTCAGSRRADRVGRRYGTNPTNGYVHVSTVT